MKQLFKLYITMTALLIFSSANASQWQVDPDHTQIRFKVNHILTTVSGQFNAFQGDIVFDPDNLFSSHFDFVVQVKSVNTNHGKRDNHLRSKDFFNSDKYPEMKFKTSSVTHLKDNIYRLGGMLTIKDVTQKIEMDFHYLNPKPHPFVKGKNVGGFITRFSIPRLDYHVGNGKFLKMGVVGSRVDVEIEMEALTKN